eukprot:TRINITY_DN8013_c0_g1_i1.p1 TRINITY_DN8013_c0_g1~~TRINITY_DN8013_c0_g1_i1.p1  ORF type:complete len:131 (-),score=16.54 TRINITY_DN8013_c0_g1_i1:33-425(-)
MIYFLARLLFASSFLLKSANDLTTQGRERLGSILRPILLTVGIPFEYVEYCIWTVSGLQLLGALMVALGFSVRMGSLLLAIATLLQFYTILPVSNLNLEGAELTNFSHYLSLIGGLWILYQLGSYKAHNK